MEATHCCGRRDANFTLYSEMNLPRGNNHTCICRPTMRKKGVSCIVTLYDVLSANWVNANSSAQLSCTLLLYNMLCKVEYMRSETQIPCGRPCVVQVLGMSLYSNRAFWETSAFVTGNSDLLEAETSTTHLAK